MKRKNFSLVAITIMAVAVLLHACKKDDTTPPVISLTGSSTLTQSLPATAGGGTWTDPGYSANDDKDGNITSSVVVSGTVNPNKKGTYTITYSVSDKAGNNASASRTVTIVNDAELFGGVYTSSYDTCVTSGGGQISPNPSVAVSDSVDNLISISNFGGFGAAVNVQAIISGSNINIATNQSLGGTAYIQTIYSGQTMVISASTPTAFDIKYQWNDGTNSDVCISHYRR